MISLSTPQQLYSLQKQQDMMLNLIAAQHQFEHHQEQKLLLMKQRLITAQQQQKELKVVLFDWDDTFIPTTALFKQKSIKNRNKNINKTDLTKLSESILNLLNKYSIIYGAENIFIITNGEKNWILQSLQFLINYCFQQNIKNSFECIFKLLSNGYIQTISANYLYSKQYPKKTMLWKYLIFQQIIYQKMVSMAYNNNIYNEEYKIDIICIGDSNDEYIASKNVSVLLQNNNNIKNLRLHRVKLAEYPTINDMNDQFELITSLGPIFYNKSEDTNIDYVAEKAKFRKCAV